MIRLSLLGQLGLRGPDGRPVNSVLAQPKRLALLAYLAGSHPPGPQPRDRLLLLFWPDASQDQARNALRQALHHLRRSLGEEAVVSVGDTVVVSPEALSCDVTEFRSALSSGDAKTALELYRGDFLASFHLPDAPDFEEWMDGERRRLRTQAAEAASRLAEESELAGDLVGAIAWARQGLELASDEEAPLRRLLVLLWKTGERGEALREYEAFEERFRTRFDLDPSGESQALMARIRSGDVAPSMGTPTSPRTPPDTGGEVPLDHREGAVPPRDAPEAPIPAPAPASRPRTLLRWAAGLAATGLVLGFAFVRSRTAGEVRATEKTVFVASFENLTGDPALDALGDMAGHWVAQGLQETGLIPVVDPFSSLVSGRTGSPSGEEGLELAATLARDSRATIVVWGTLHRSGDSLLIRAQVTDLPSGRLLLSLAPVGCESAAPAHCVEEMKSRAVGALANLLDARVASLTGEANHPPTLEAYADFVAGLDVFARGRNAEAAPFFLRAADADSTWALPLVWGIFAFQNAGQRPQADTLLQRLAAREARLAPLDRRALDYFRASRDDNREALWAALTDAARMAPGSNWSYLLGVHALGARRPRLAVESLEQVDPEGAWAGQWGPYWRYLQDALHVTGNYEEELRIARRLRGLRPPGPGEATDLLREAESLIGLGRLEEVDSLVAAMATLSAGGIAPGFALRQVGRELAAHGHPTEAQRAYRLALDWFRSPRARAWTRAGGPAREASRSENVSQNEALTLLDAGLWKEALEAFEARLDGSPTRLDIGGLGVAAARLGDVGKAELMVSRLEGDIAGNPRASQTPRAMLVAVAVALGDLERAKRQLVLLEQVPGADWWAWVHTSPLFEDLREDPQARALMEPLD